MEKQDFVIFSLKYSVIHIFLQIGSLTYILIGMYWWTRVASERKREALTVRKEEGNMIECPVCEHKIPFGTKTCPYCSAELRYEEDDATAVKVGEADEGGEKEEK